MTSPQRSRKINLICGKCSEVLWEGLTDYQQGDGSQGHLAAEIYTNVWPTYFSRLVDKRIGGTHGKSFNCSNDCHNGRWLIDAGTGQIDREGFTFVMACGPEFVRVEVAEDSVSHTLQSAIAMGKFAAGLIRFLSEDAYNGICQAIYLCKSWHNDAMTDATRAFIIVSICSGVVCSLMGPIKEWVRLGSLRTQRRLPDAALNYYEDLPQEDLAIDKADIYSWRSLLNTKGKKKKQVGIAITSIEHFESNELHETLLRSVKSAGASFDSVQDMREHVDLVLFDQHRNLMEDSSNSPPLESFPLTLVASFEAEVQSSASASPIEQRRDSKAGSALVLKDVSVRRFLLDSQDDSSKRASNMLLLCALLYWTSNIFIYLFFDVECGGGIPKSAWLIFIVMVTVVLMIELWVLIHSTQGYLLFRNCRSSFLFGITFGNMGRFDTFSDVGSALAIRSCARDDPEFYSWFSISDRRFNLPTDLGTLMLIGMALILFLQIIPGVYLLLRQKWLPIAYKLNELTIILAAMDEELLDTEENNRIHSS